MINCRLDEKYEPLNINEIRNPYKNFSVDIKYLYIHKKKGTIFNIKPTDFNTSEYRVVQSIPEREKSILKIIKELLYTIELPKYYYSKKNSDYFKNGRAHKRGKVYLLIDLENFFPNCKMKRVQSFLCNQGKLGFSCPPDVGYKIAEMITSGKKNYRHVPQGYPTSTVVAFLSYYEMFEEIFKLSKKYNCRFSCYVDDLSFSYNGKLKNENDILEHLFELYTLTVEIIEKYELSLNDRKVIINNDVIITGMNVTKTKFVASPKIHRKLNVSFKRCSTFKVQNKNDFLLLWKNFNEFRGLYYTLTKYIETEYKNEKMRRFLMKNNKKFPMHKNIDKLSSSEINGYYNKFINLNGH